VRRLKTWPVTDVQPLHLESPAEILAAENARLAHEVEQLREELDRKRREVSHLRVELGEEKAA
jgi:hypothetical protein